MALFYRRVAQLFRSLRSSSLELGPIRRGPFGHFCPVSGPHSVPRLQVALVRLHQRHASEAGLWKQATKTATALLAVSQKPQERARARALIDQNRVVLKPLNNIL
jgi:hypothetical protein